MNINIADIAIVLVVILISMTLHEAMHGYMAYWLGDHTAKAEGRLTLNPLAHIDPFLTIILPILLAITGAPIFGGAKPVPFNPYGVKYGDFGAALVGVAGPLTNLVIAFVMFAAFVVAGGPAQGSDLSTLSYFFILGVVVNLGFFIFNMLPIPPLDGSRVLYALAPDGIKEMMGAIERHGIILIFILVMFFSGQIGQIIYAGQSAIIQFFSMIFGVQVVL